jgi:multiple sugar transport system substrate-binding protein
MMSLVLLMVVSTLLAACSSSDTQSDEVRVLRVGVAQQDGDLVRRDYTDDYDLVRTNVEVAITSPPQIEGYDTMTEAEWADVSYQSIVTMLTGENPVDVLMLDDYGLMQQLIADNYLRPLDPYIADARFDLTDISPGVLDAMKQLGDGSLYTLVPSYLTDALFYNKTLFEEAGLTPPTDGMMWEEIFDLARRVTSGEGDERIYGFAAPLTSTSWVTDYYGLQQQLRTYDATGTLMTVNTPQWKQSFEDIYSLYREEVWPSDEVAASIQMGQNGLFTAGRLAMTTASLGYLQDLQSWFADEIDFEWDVVSLPQHPDALGVGWNMEMYGMAAINANALNAEDAWDFLSFLNSPERALVKAASNSLQLVSSLSAQQQTITDYNVGAFNLLSPIPPAKESERKMLQTSPNIIASKEAGYEFFNQVKLGELTVEEALAAWEAAGNAILQGQ